MDVAHFYFKVNRTLLTIYIYFSGELFCSVNIHSSCLLVVGINKFDIVILFKGTITVIIISRHYCGRLTGCTL